MARGGVGHRVRAAQRASRTRGLAAVGSMARCARALARTGGGRRRGHEAVAATGAPRSGPAAEVGARTVATTEPALKWKRPRACYRRLKGRVRMQVTGACAARARVHAANARRAREDRGMADARERCVRAHDVRAHACYVHMRRA
eukprot:1153065-Pleurochrysis_carterae.AAC.1